MIEQQQGEMTLNQIADTIGASVYSVRKAIEAMNIKGRTPLNDRRVVLYPRGTDERVKQWLITNNP